MPRPKYSALIYLGAAVVTGCRNEGAPQTDPSTLAHNVAISRLARGIGRIGLERVPAPDLDGAIQDFEFVHKAEPANREATFELADALRRKGENVRAISLYRQLAAGSDPYAKLSRKHLTQLGAS